MAAGKEEEKGEKDKEKMAGKVEKKEEKEKEKAEEGKKEDGEVITAIYKINLHCQQCGSKIRKHLMVTQGVQNVDIDFEKGEIKAKGKIDPLKILKLIEKKSKKRVELISPKIKVKESPPVEQKPKEIKEPIIRTITVKVHMHCDQCETDLRNRLIKHKGIFSAKTDKKAKTVTVEGAIEPEKLISFLRKRVHKNAEIVSVKEEKKGEKKEKGKEEGKSSEEKGEKKEKGKEEGKSSEEKGEKKEKGKEEGKSSEATKDKDGVKSGEATKSKEDAKSGAGESTKDKGDGKSGGPIKEKGEDKSGETTQIIEIPGDTKVEISVKDNVPYIIHYVYAPQLFSDENPNACSIA